MSRASSPSQASGGSEETGGSGGGDGGSLMSRFCVEGEDLPSGKPLQPLEHVPNGLVHELMKFRSNSS